VTSREQDLLAALCDATAVDIETYFNDDKVEHGRAVLKNLEAAGYTVVPLPEAPAPVRAPKKHQHQVSLFAGNAQAYYYCGARGCDWREDYPSAKDRQRS
jgi:hypothetical protein